MHNNANKQKTGLSLLVFLFGITLSQNVLANAETYSTENSLLVCKDAPPSTEKRRFYNLPQNNPELLKIAYCFDDNLLQLQKQQAKLAQTSLLQAPYFYETLAKLDVGTSKVNLNNALLDSGLFALQLQEWLLFSPINTELSQKPLSKWSEADFDELLDMPNNRLSLYRLGDRFLIFFQVDSAARNTTKYIVSLEKTNAGIIAQSVKMEEFADGELSLVPAYVTTDNEFDPVTGKLISINHETGGNTTSQYTLEGNIFRLEEETANGEIGTDEEDIVSYKRKH